MNSTYRMKPSYAYLMAGTLSFFLLFGLIVFFGAEGAVPEYRLLFVLLCGSVPLLMAGASVHGLVAYRRHRLVVRDAGIEYTGVRHRVAIAFGDATEAHWRLGGGALVILSPAGKVTIHFDNYSRPNQQALIRFFRHRLPEAVQKGWEKFWQSHWRVFDEPDMSKPEFVAKKRCAIRRRMDTILLLSLLLMVLPTCAIAWHWCGAWEAVRLMGAMAFALLVMWIMFRCSVPVPGQVGETLSAGERLNWALVASASVVPLGSIAVVLCAAFDVPVNNTLILSVVTLSLPGLFWGFREQDRRMRALREQAAQMAARLYMSSTTMSPEPPPSEP